ncbi:MAG: DNA-3-methyladenine glycosylase I, DNA-3-methyladenine glycosylase I [Candidatus Saccharibacteria bacterium GW2011_GWC2_44_17]|nr:MAG: DNA-3-methyladenine glycosylase I, DNA-3-methyladenine glycosylase I [Candidatus Saccharibacteria bacterium GW2011_GWC2_44_17]OGL34074.1 MAG: DNA-3-methyladenine glycosylase [Candidatus Saccharibacteria bacterium RIFCSPHIGHO2_12_FULL_47_16]
MRCSWAESSDVERHYHDAEWGVPVRDDQRLFEFLVLEGAQAGLSWSTILNRREGYRTAFHNFDIDAVASMADDELEKLREDTGIIRNRLKIYSARKNAFAAQAIIREHGSLAKYLWSFVDNISVDGARGSISEVPATTERSDAMSSALKKAGFTFVGPTICYAFMQATGMVNDHVATCFRYREIRA